MHIAQNIEHRATSELVQIHVSYVLTVPMSLSSYEHSLFDLMSLILFHHFCLFHSFCFLFHDDSWILSGDA